MKKDLTAKALWKWANGFTRRSKEGDDCPTLRTAARHFGCSMDDIEAVMGDDLDGDKYLGLATGWRCANGGVSVIENRGDYLIEAY